MPGISPLLNRHSTNFAQLNRQFPEQNKKGEAGNITNTVVSCDDALHSPDSGFSSGSSNSATQVAQKKLNRSIPMDRRENSYGTSNSIAANKEPQRNKSLDSSISDITKISDALKIKLSPNAEAWLDRTISDTSSTSATSSLDLLFNSLTDKVDKKLFEMNKDHSQLAESESVIKKSKQQLQSIKLSLNEIPIKLQLEKIKGDTSHDTGSTSSISQIRLEKALHIVAQELEKIDSEILVYKNRAAAFSVADKHNNFSLSVNKLFDRPIWDDSRATYAKNFHQELKNLRNELSEIRNEVNNALIESSSTNDHASISTDRSFGSSDSSIVSSISSFIKKSTHPLMLDAELFTGISTALNNLDMSNYPQAKEKLNQISLSINTLSKNMASTQLESQLALNNNPEYGEKEKQFFSYALAYNTGYEQTRSIKNNLKDLATSLEKNIGEAAQDLSSTLRTCAKLFNAQDKRYKAEMATARLEAHAIFEAKHLLKNLNEAPPGSKVDIASSFEIKGGMGQLPTQLPGNHLLRLNVLAKLGTAHNETYGANAYGKYYYKNEYSGGVGLEANAAGMGISAGFSATANRTRRSDYYEAKTPEALIKHKTTKKNDQRYLPQPLLDSAVIQNTGKDYVVIKNVLNKISGLNPSDPNEPIFVTTKMLKAAVGSEIIIQDCLKKLGITPLHSQDPFNLHEITPISTGKTIASIPGTALAQKNPSVVTTYEVSGNAGIGTSGAYPYVSQIKPFASLLPTVNRSTSATATFTNTLFNGTALKPTHELMSTAHTQNYKESMAIAQKVLSMWHTKSGSMSLPNHLQEASALIAKIALPITQENFISHIHDASQALTKLQTNFDCFEKSAAFFKDAIRKNVALDHPYYRSEYINCVKEMAQHQLHGDKKLPQEPQKKLGNAQLDEDAQETIGRTWDTYSSALGMIELSVLGKIPKDTQDPMLQEALEQFVTQYTRLAKKIALPNLPLTQDELYRHAAIVSPEVDEKKSLSAKTESTLIITMPNPLNLLREHEETPLISGKAGQMYDSGALKFSDTVTILNYEKTVPKQTSKQSA